MDRARPYGYARARINRRNSGAPNFARLARPSEVSNFPPLAVSSGGVFAGYLEMF